MARCAYKASIFSYSDLECTDLVCGKHNVMLRHFRGKCLWIQLAVAAHQEFATWHIANGWDYHIDAIDGSPKVPKFNHS